MKRATIIILLILICQGLYSQDGPTGYCVKTKNLTRSDLKTVFPFDKTTKVQLVSFKPDFENESTPMKDELIDTTKFIETKTLNLSQENGLIDILYNYTFDPKINKDSITLEIAMCYEPRNAILFKDKKNEIISYLEICFECLQYRNPKGDLSLVIFCQDKYSRLKNYFGLMGIKFGVTEK